MSYLHIALNNEKISEIEGYENCDEREEQEGVLKRLFWKFMDFNDF